MKPYMHLLPSVTGSPRWALCIAPRPGSPPSRSLQHRSWLQATSLPLRCANFSHVATDSHTVADWAAPRGRCSSSHSTHSSLRHTKAMSQAPLAPVQIPTTLAASLFTSASQVLETQWLVCEAVILPWCCRSLCPHYCFLTQHNQLFLGLFCKLDQLGCSLYPICLPDLNKHSGSWQRAICHRSKDKTTNTPPRTSTLFHGKLYHRGNVHEIWQWAIARPLLSHPHMRLPLFLGDPFPVGAKPDAEGPYFCSQEWNAGSLHSCWQCSLSWATKLLHA